MENRVAYFAETDARNKRAKFGIKTGDRSRHMYVIGKTGMGKSTLLENMAIQDIQSGAGLAFIDPHGKTADLLLDYIPQNRIKDVLYFAPFDLDYPVAFNVMEDVGYDKRHLVASGLMSAFKKIWVDAWSARMEYILNNILLALLEYPGATLIGVNRMLADKDYRKKVVDNINDPSVKAFWTDEFAKYGDRYMQEAGAAIQNKVGQFVSNPVVRNIIGQSKSTFDLRKIMDERKIVIINLSKGRVGEANANLLGSMLITKIYLAAMSRADASPAYLKTLPNFYLYVDEFQSFANESFADILSEARKYNLNLLIAHQYIEQMSEEVRAAVFGNVGTMVVFRVGAFDAEVLEKEFFPTFTKEDLVNLGFVQVYLKLMIDGVTSPPFSARTLPPIEKPDITFKEDIIEFSRTAFAHPRLEVEQSIKDWHAPVQVPAIKPAARKEPDARPTESAGTRSPAPIRSNNSSERSQPPLQTPVSSVVPITPPVRPISKSVPEPVKVVEAVTIVRPVSIQKDTPKPNPKNALKNTQKVPTAKNLSALRDALSAVMKNPLPVPPVPSSAPKKPELKPEPKIESTAEQKIESKSVGEEESKEVPEEILRRILDN